MKIESISYKRVKNLGNFQSETFEATAIVHESEDLDMAVDQLKGFVLAKLYAPVVKEDDAEIPEGF